MKTQPQPGRHATRNLIIFAVVTLSAGWLGAFLNNATEAPDPAQGLGTLVWLLLPMITALLLRAFGGDGWKDAGLRPHFKSAWMGYVLALLVFPLLSIVVFGLGLSAGAFSAAGFQTQGVSTFVSLVAVAFISSFVKNIFEEFAWRGYLSGRFASLKLNPIVNHLFTGIIWAGWHIPYWLFFVNIGQFSSLDLPAYLVVSVLTLVATAITYGELRLLTDSVWPAVILHSVANAITATFLLNGFIELNGLPGIILSPGNDGILHSILFTLIGIGLFLYRTRNVSRTDPVATKVETRHVASLPKE
jgi:membrane protease YdiL (CAAX protease family)